MKKHVVLRRSLAALFALFLAPCAALAFSGKVAVAYPVQGIAVDGDLSDWPAELERYPLLFADDGDPLRGEGDFRGQFRVGYSASENALYVAVEVEDDDVVRRPVPDSPGWKAQDGCEVYVAGHRPGERAPVQYRIWGGERGTYGPGSTDEMQVQVRWGEGKYQYEWRIDLEETRLRPGLELGFDLSIWDRDRDGSATWIAWSRGVGKYMNAGRLGTLLMVAPGTPPEQAQVKVEQLGEERARSVQQESARSTGYQMFMCGVLLAITFLHLLLFLFERSSRANLFYALYTGATGLAIFSGFELEFGNYLDPQFIRVLKESALLFIGMLGLGFLYAFFNIRPPRRFWLTLYFLVLPTLLGMCVVVYLDQSGILSVPFFYSLNRLVVRGLTAGVFLETLLAIFNAVRGRREGAWMIGAGFTLFALSLSSLVFARRIDISDLYWALIPLASMSVYLARSLARTHRELQEHLVQVEELSARTRQQYEQIQAQNEKIREANRLKSQFLARMSHDLRTPMNAIIGYTRILLRKLEGQIEERQYRNLENVQTSATHLLALINDILDLSRIEAGRIDIKPEDVDLRALVGECAAAVEPLLKPGVVLRQELGEVPSVHTDADRVRRVLMNLLGNAVKFTEAGSITLAVREVGGRVEFRVADTGVGIPAADLPHIFDEFRQVEKSGHKQEGTGLGLAIVKKSVDLLGGTIAVESEEGKGTTFTLRMGDYVGAEAEPATR